MYLTRRPGNTFRREIINISLVKYKYIIMTNLIFLCSMFLLIIIIKSIIDVGGVSLWVMTVLWNMEMWKNCTQYCVYFVRFWCLYNLKLLSYDQKKGWVHKHNNHLFSCYINCRHVAVLDVNIFYVFLWIESVAASCVCDFRSLIPCNTEINQHL